MMEMNEIEKIDQDFLLRQTRLLCESYFYWTGRPLIDSDLTRPEIVGELFEADVAVLSHDTQRDPVFNYANRCAMDLFGMDWQEITGLPSRHSAEAMLQAARAHFLEQVSRFGYVDDYAGIRIAKHGRRFLIKHATVWNLVDATGLAQGQAAIIRDWDWL
jgi:hypothetical protein